MRMIIDYFSSRTFMKSKIFIAMLGVLCVATGVASAQSLPKMKAGMWEDTFNVEMAKSKDQRSSLVNPPGVSFRCNDDAMIQQSMKMAQATAGKSCRQDAFLFSGNKATQNMECKLGNSIMRTTTVITFNGDTSYRTDAKIVYDPPLDPPSPGIVDMAMTMESRYLGPCKPGMKIGDVVMNGVTTNILSSSGTFNPPTMDEAFSPLENLYAEFKTVEAAKAAAAAADKVAKPPGYSGLSGILISVGMAAAGVRSKNGGVSRNAEIVGAVADAVSAISIDDNDVRKMASYLATQSDVGNTVVAASSVYAKRLDKLTKNLTAYDDLNLNFKVYQSDVVNAFAMADGTVRLYTGLMDAMTDDELRFVIGHEIGHVKQGHGSATIKNAFLTSALVKGGAASALKNKNGALLVNLAGDQAKQLLKQVLSSAYSRSQETEADVYSVAFMKKNRIPTKAGPSALLKLAKASGERSASFLATHPDPADRADAVEKLSAQQ
jgi:metalloprotease